MKNKQTTTNTVCLYCVKSFCIAIKKGEAIAWSLRQLRERSVRRGEVVHSEWVEQQLEKWDGERKRIGDYEKSPQLSNRAKAC